MNRRELLMAAGGAAVAATTTTAFAGMDHSMHHGNHGAKYQALVAEAKNCSVEGILCLQHCFDTFDKGDTGLAKCARVTNDMIHSCDTLTNLAASDSAHLKAVAQACVSVLKECEDECRKQQAKHPVCAKSADACAKCIAECQKIIG